MTDRIGIVGSTVSLYVQFVDADGVAVNTDDTPSIEIKNPLEVVKRAASSIGVGMVDVDKPGLYVYHYDIPSNADDGYWADTWTAKIGATEISTTFQFEVITSGTATAAVEPVVELGDEVPWDLNEEERVGINVLLQSLKARLKSDGTRRERDGDSYVEVDCSIFTDTELILFLINSLSTFNQSPHFTSFFFSDIQIYTTFLSIIVQGAVILALASQYLLERGREFTLGDNGLSYTPPTMSEAINTQYGAILTDYKDQLKVIKGSMKPAAIGLGSWRVTAISPNYLRLRHLRARQII